MASPGPNLDQSQSTHEIPVNSNFCHFWEMDFLKRGHQAHLLPEGPRPSSPVVCPGGDIVPGPVVAAT
jgi:hypothetical protein